MRLCHAAMSLLRASSADNWQLTAAIELLIAHDSWLHDPALRTYLQGSWASDGTFLVYLDWRTMAEELGLYRDAVTTLRRGGAPDKATTALQQWSDQHNERLVTLDGSTSENALSARTRSGRVLGRPVTRRGTPIAARTGMNCGLSPRCPAVSTMARGFCPCSQPRCSFVVNPPRERPSAWSAGSTLTPPGGSACRSPFSSPRPRAGGRGRWSSPPTHPR